MLVFGVIFLVREIALLLIGHKIRKKVGGKTMWLIFVLFAIIATFVNLYLYKIGRNYHLAMALGLSFTALTLAASYSRLADRVIAEDWTFLLDIVPTMSVVFWVLTVISILLNILPAVLAFKNRK